MYVQIRRQYQDDYLVLVDWSVLDEYWHQQPDRDSFFDKYLWLWFSSNNNEIRFNVPEIGWDVSDYSLSFTNGRNRTALVTKHQTIMPIAVDYDFFHVPVCKKAIIQVLTDDDYVELPDLPIMTPEEWTEHLSNVKN